MENGLNKNYLFEIRNTLHMLDLLENGHGDYVREWCQDNVNRRDNKYHSNIYNKLIERNLGFRTEKGFIESNCTGYYRPNLTCQIEILPYLMEQVFGQKSTGYFVEVGGFDGEHYSNTSFLADIGWSGLYIEPIAEYYQLCRYRHAVNPGVRVLNGSVGRAQDLIDIQIAMMSSTSNQALMDNLKNLDYSRDWIREEKRQSLTCRLDFYLEKSDVPRDFDLLVLDVEGAEWDAVQGIDFEVWHPQMVIIELLDCHQDFAGNQELFDIAIQCRTHLTQWYDELYLDEGNTVYIRRYPGT